MFCLMVLVCATGVWILYASTEYGSGADWWVYGTDYCSDVPAPFDNTASSIRKEEIHVKMLNKIL